MNKVTNDDLAALRQAGVSTLPSNPSKHGMSEEEIKAHYTVPQTMLFNWLKAFEDEAESTIVANLAEAKQYADDKATNLETDINVLDGNTAYALDELRTRIDGEEARSQAVDEEHGASISSNATAISAESARAKAVEATLSTIADTDSKDADVLSSAKTYANEVASGKSASYVLSYSQKELEEGNVLYEDAYRQDGTRIETYADYQSYVSGHELLNPYFNSQAESIGLNGPSYVILGDYGKYTIVKDFSYFKVGDIVYVSETGVPDRWYSGNGADSFYKMETAKVDLSSYAKQSSLDVSDERISALEAAKDQCVSDYADANEKLTEATDTYNALNPKIASLDTAIDSTLTQTEYNSLSSYEDKIYFVTED